MFGLGYVDPALISAVLRRRAPSASFSPFGGFGSGGFMRYPRLPAPINRPLSLGPSQGLSPSAMLAAMRGAGTYYGSPQPAPPSPPPAHNLKNVRLPGQAGGGYFVPSGGGSASNAERQLPSAIRGMT